MAKNLDRAEVVIIGAGASGGAFAWRLADLGFQVVCLEQGDWLKPSDYTTDTLEWEIHKQTDFNASPNVRGLKSDYPVNEDDSPISPLMYNAVGGSTIHWTSVFPRFHPSDFRVRSLDGVADDWPISYEQLEPYYDLNDRMMGVSGLSGNPAYPARSSNIKSQIPLPPLPLGKIGEKVASGFEKLGWHWWPIDFAINSVSYDGRPGCNNCGPCEMGCYISAKASTDVTYWPKAISLGANLRTNCRVREITVNKQGLADGVIFYDENNAIQEIKANIVVLAANGIGTPRIMLNSKSSLFPNGIANNNDTVGRNLMFHPLSTAMGVFDEDLESFKGPVASTVGSHEFYETDETRGFVRGFQMGGTRFPATPVATTLGIGASSGSSVPWGKNHHEVFKERYGRCITYGILGEDLPELHNRVTLDTNLSDDDGIPAPKVSYTLSENSENMMNFAEKRTKEAIEASGGSKVFIDHITRPSGWHLMGTARMGDNPETSVVNSFGQTHEVKNLYVIDGSIFTTSAAVNPTTTIQALALYVADQLNSNSRNL